MPEALVRFLDFVRADVEESTKDFDDVFILRLQDTIRRIKNNREMDERMEAKAEAVLVLLQEIGAIPDELTEKIMNEKNPTVLNEYLKYAAKAESIEDFAHKFA